MKKSRGDEACEILVVPSCSFSAEADGILARGLSGEVVGDVPAGGKVGWALSVLTRHSSSRKTMSMTQCKEFSVAQWARIIGPTAAARITSEVM